jgi:hypothetical protein
MEDDMTFYVCTDGYIQQLGGEKNISYGKKRRGQLMINISKDNFDDQKLKIMQVFHEYQGTNDIQDDITFVGFKL